MLEVNANEYQQFASQTAVDPMGPSTGESRVLRGGCWDFSGRDCRSAYRSRLGPRYRNYDCGFRVAKVSRANESSLV
jgi:formylglycine-generating enzyme